MTKGLWVTPDKFQSFAEPGVLTKDIAVRSRTTAGFVDMLTWLPNPDKILKAQGKDIGVYRDLRTEAIVGGPLRRRTSAVQSLERNLERGQAGARVLANVRDWLADMPVNEWIAQFVDAAYMGYAPQEITWARSGDLTLPAAVVAKPQEWFVFDAENRLRFRSMENPLEGELLPPGKFLCPTQGASYLNPYGFPDLCMVFWPIVFKTGGLKFWLRFTEKYGMPWPVGKLPRGAGPAEEDRLLDALGNMIQDAVAVIPDDASVELLQISGGASGDLYEQLVMYCRSEVNIALTGTNQTTEAAGNRVMAGIEVSEDLRDATAEIAVDALNELIRLVVAENWGGPAPLWSLQDKEKRDQLQAERDKKVFDAGGRFTNRYWMDAYGYQAAHLVAEVTAVGPASAGLAFAEPGGSVGLKPDLRARAPVPTDYIDAATGTLAEAAGTAWQDILDQVKALAVTAADEGVSLGDFRDQLLGAFGDLDSTQLEAVMALGFACADLAGRFDVKAGN